MKDLKIAFLITAYESADNVNRFIEQIMKYKYSYVFIHIDSKSEINREEILKNERIYIMPIEKCISVYWGDYSQIVSVVELMKFARQNGEFDYFSLHSESDMLVRPILDLVEFLKADSAYAYTWCYPLPYNKWQYGGGMGRIAMHWPVVLRRKYKRYSPYRIIRAIYGRMYSLHLIKRKKMPNDIKFWGRCDWFTISLDCVDEVINVYENNHEFNKIFEDSLIGSEIYFTTVAHFHDDKNRVVSDNCLRYIDFTNYDRKKPGSPKVIGMEDVEKIEKSGKFFARKFDKTYDKKVIDYYSSK